MTTHHLTGLAGAAAGRLALRNIDRINDTLGIKPPAALTKELARLDENRANIFAELADQPALAEVLADSVATGEQILTRPNIQTIIAADAFKNMNVSAVVESAHEKQVRSTIVQHLPALFKAWAKPVAEAGEAITKAKAELPGKSLRDPETAAKLTPSQFKTWAPGHAAVKALDDVLSHAPNIYGLTPVGIPAQHRQALILAPLTLTQLEELAAQQHSPDPRNRYVRRLEDIDGVKMSLADPDELKTRLEAVSREVAGRTQAHAERSQAARRRDTATPFDEATLARTGFLPD